MHIPINPWTVHTHKGGLYIMFDFLCLLKVLTNYECVICTLSSDPPFLVSATLSHPLICNMKVLYTHCDCVVAQLQCVLFTPIGSELQSDQISSDHDLENDFPTGEIPLKLPVVNRVGEW